MRTVLLFSPPILQRGDCELIVARGDLHGVEIVTEQTATVSAPNDWARMIWDAQRDYEAHVLIADLEGSDEVIKALLAQHGIGATVIHRRVARRLLLDDALDAYRSGFLTNARAFPALIEEIGKANQGERRDLPRLTLVAFALRYLATPVAERL